MRAKIHSLMAAAALLAVAAAVPAAERQCEQSESTVVAAPDGRHAASVQHQVCATAAGGVAAAITVFVGDAAAPLTGGRVLSVAVPPSRSEWPRAVWRDARSLEVWVPNFAKILESREAHGDVRVMLRYCAGDPDARERVARHEADLQQWMQAVSRWAAQRREDPASVGPRPPRPEEPRVIKRPCSDAEIGSGHGN